MFEVFCSYFHRGFCLLLLTTANPWRGQGSFQATSLALLHNSQPWHLLTAKSPPETTTAILFLSLKVSRRLGNVFYMMNLPLSMPLPPAPGKPPEQPSDITSPLRCNSSGDALDSPCSQGLETSKTVEQIVSESRDHPCDADGPQADFQMITFQKSWAGPKT